MTTAQLAELLILARNASPAEFLRLYNAMQQPLSVPTMSMLDAVDMLETMHQDETRTCCARAKKSCK